ncbi:L-cystine transport system permease protein TcyL [compost metagenome]
MGLDISKTSALYFVILTYSLHSGAYISEMIRGAITAVNLGQVEAAYAMGMNGYQAFSRIVLPQAIAISIPVFANLVIGNLKDTSLAFSLGIMEMTGTARTIGALSQRFVEIYISLALLYLLISFALQKLFVYVERRLHRHESDTMATQRERSGRRRLFHKFESISDIPSKEARL